MKMTPIEEVPSKARRTRIVWLNVFKRLETEFPNQWVKLGHKYKNPSSASAAAHSVRTKYCSNGHAHIDVVARGKTMFMRAKRRVGRTRRANKA